MPDRDINIHVRAKGAEQAQRDLEQTAESTKTLGRETSEAGHKAAAAADGLEKTGQKAGGLKSILDNLKTSVFGFVSAWAGWETITNALEGIVNGLREVRQAMREVHDESRTLIGAAQNLEIQTGSIGRQSEWATYLSELQAAGGLGSIAVAEQMAISFDVATSKTGGISSRANQDLLKKLAPMFGAAQTGAGDVAKFFEYTSTMGVAPTEKAYQDAFAMLLAGYRSSKTTTGFGTYVSGLQAGTTGILAQGGSPEGAITLYTTARAVTQNESVAATLAEQIGRISGGAYERPRQVLEQFAGKPWSSLTPDEQLETLLLYTQQIPESQRVQVLTKQGFAPELATGLAKVASEKGLEVLRGTRQAIQGAGREQLQKQVEAYKETTVGRARTQQGQRGLEFLGAETEIGSFQDRLKAAADRVKAMKARGKDRFWTEDEYEAYLVAYEQMDKELLQAYAQLEKIDSLAARQLQKEIMSLRIDISGSMYELTGKPIIGHGISQLSRWNEEWAARKGPGYEQELRDIGGRTQQIINNYYESHDIHYHMPEGRTEPRAGKRNADGTYSLE